MSCASSDAGNSASEVGGAETAVQLDIGKQSRMLSASAGMLDGPDASIVQAGSAVTQQITQMDMTKVLAKADDMFQAILDPGDPEAKKKMDDLFYEPMITIHTKINDTVGNINTGDTEDVKTKLSTSRELLKFAEEQRQSCLDGIYDDMERKVNMFGVSVEQYNAAMKATVEQALCLYASRVNTEIEARSKALEQRQKEHKAMLEAAEAENICFVNNVERTSVAEAAASERRLALAKMREEHQLQAQKAKDEQSNEREQQAIEREKKRLDMEQGKLDRELEREKTKASNELERKERQGKIDKEKRNAIMEEFQVEMTRYNKEYDLAVCAMKDAIEKGGRCQMRHTAPKIQWGESPTVIPGSISWERIR